MTGNAVLIKKKKFIVVGIKKALDTVFKSLDSLIKNYSEDGSSYDLLLSLNETLDSEFKAIKEIHDELLNLIEEEEELEKEITEMMNFKLQVKEVQIKVRKIITTNSIAETRSNLSNSSDSLKNIKLPKLELEKFKGDPTKWHTFFDSFDSAIHQNDQLSKTSNIQKMTYLRSLLEGSASEAIAGLTLSNENYLHAVDMLKARFGDEQVLISSHMNILLKIEPVKSVSDVKGIRKIYDNIESQVRSLYNLGIDSKQYGPMLIPILTSKIPEELNLIISRNVGKGIWDIDGVLKILRNEVEARERLPPCENLNKNYEKRPHSTGTFLNSEVSSRRHEKNHDRCLFCNSKDHLAHKCKVVTDVCARKSIIQNKNRCFKCLRPGHTSKKCRSKISCYKCKENHHAAVCLLVENIEPKKQEINEAKVPQAKNDNKVENNDQIGLLVTGRNVGLLQTAVAKVCDVEEKRFASLRILFDSGSQGSYITPEARKLLNLKTESKSSMVLKTFATQNRKRTLEKVKFCVKGNRGESVYVSALVSEICTPISGQFVNLAQEKYEHLRHLNLADHNPEGDRLCIDILIGADFYWPFMTGKIIKSDTDRFAPVAMQSILGYILSGEIVVTEDVTCSSSTNFNEIIALKVSTEFTESDHLRKTLNNVWEIESYNFKDNDPDVVKEFKDNITFSDRRYEVMLPFREDFDIIQDNFELCKNRLKGLAKKFKGDPELFKKYKEIIDNQKEEGIIEAANDEVEEFKGY